jgi:uncharacterized surface protein with fasciclin (FAS1) repeats
MVRAASFRPGLVSLLAALVAALAIGAAATTGDARGASNASAATLPGTLVADGNFKTLVSLLQATGLDKVLATAGPFTVFAPNDAAFAKVPPATLAFLAANPDALTSVLLYHVVPGRVPSSVATTLSSAPTVNGATLGLSVVGGSLYVNNAKVTAADVSADNGVAHVVDTVLIPPAAMAGGENNAGYCAVAGNTTPAGQPIPAGTFLLLKLGQPSWDYHYAGATPAIYVGGQGITCDAPPAGLQQTGTAPDSLGVPGGLYPYFPRS